MASDTISVGNAGEHLVAARLLSFGFHVFIADRNNKAFDLAVFKDGKHSLLRVKTSTSNSIPWNAKTNGKIFLELQEENDFCVIVPNFNQPKFEQDFFIVPTKIVNDTLNIGHKEWLKYPKRDGTDRKDGARRGLYPSGNPQNIARGYGEKWKQYKNNWDQLKYSTS